MKLNSFNSLSGELNLGRERYFDEGLGTVYERVMLNSFLDTLINSYQIKRVLEAPIYGMNGLTGINSVHFVNRGCKLIMIDSKREKVREAIELWNILPYKGRYEILYHDNLSKLPFRDGSFDLVWDFAALWHVREADLLLSEMARVSSNLLLIFVPNKIQIGYFLRKYLLDRNFFKFVNEKWINIKIVRSFIKSLGLKIEAEGVLDVPPWPDTCFPISRILDKFGRSNEKVNSDKGRWRWDIMSYYSGKDLTLKQRVEKFSFIERLSIPWQIKALWAHHRYLLFSKS